MLRRQGAVGRPLFVKLSSSPSSFQLELRCDARSASCEPSTWSMSSNRTPSDSDSVCCLRSRGLLGLALGAVPCTACSMSMSVHLFWQPKRVRLLLHGPRPTTSPIRQDENLHARPACWHCTRGVPPRVGQCLLFGFVVDLLWFRLPVEGLPARSICLEFFQVRLQDGIAAQMFCRRGCFLYRLHSHSCVFASGLCPPWPSSQPLCRSAVGRQCLLRGRL